MNTFAFEGILGQWFSGAGLSWLIYDNNGVVALSVYDGQPRHDSSTTAILSNTLYYFEVWQDIVGNTINIALNRGTSVSPKPARNLHKVRQTH